MGQYDSQIQTAVQGVLRRAPNQAELASFNSLLAGSWSPTDMVSFLIESAEATNYSHPMVRLYRGAYDRAPDGPGMDFWVGALRNGSQTIASACDAFCHPDTAEFVDVYGIDPPHEDFVRQIYAVCMQRPIDNAGLQYWVGQLENGATRGSVMLGFVQSTEMINTQMSSVVAYLTAEGLGQ